MSMLETVDTIKSCDEYRVDALIMRHLRNNFFLSHKNDFYENP